jgi:hypothetical protein
MVVWTSVKRWEEWKHPFDVARTVQTMKKAKYKSSGNNAVTSLEGKYHIKLAPEFPELKTIKSI